jgi:hypothetical protein
MGQCLSTDSVRRSGAMQNALYRPLGMRKMPNGTSHQGKGNNASKGCSPKNRSVHVVDMNVSWYLQVRDGDIDGGRR